jgi:hypothetical protein
MALFPNLGSGRLALARRHTRHCRLGGQLTGWPNPHVGIAESHRVRLGPVAGYLDRHLQPFDGSVSGTPEM